MPRAQEFNESDALTSAMHAFRKFGYNGVSIKTLESETGLSSGSIYNSFGGKDDVFGRTLEHYNDTVVKKRIQTHLTPADPVAGLASLFASLLAEPDGGSFGCLLTNTAVEFLGTDTAVGMAVQSGFRMLLTAFEDILMHVPQMQPDVAKIGALRLLAYYQGLLVLIRHGHDKQALHATLKTEIEAIVEVSGT